MAAVDLKALRARIETSFLGRCAGAFVEVQGLDRAMVIASQAFTALIPLLILVSAAIPLDDDTELADVMIRRFGLSGESASSMEAIFTTSQSTSIGVLSVGLVLFSAITLTRRVQRMYLSAWRLPMLRSRSQSVNAVLGLLAILFMIVAMYALRRLVVVAQWHAVVGLSVTFVTAAALWTLIPWLLLGHRVSWRRLLPGGALVGVCTNIYAVATTIYMPRLMETYSARYGLFGVSIAMVSWLLCISFILVLATVICAEIDRSPEPWAARVSGRRTPDESDGDPDGHRAGATSSRRDDAAAEAQDIGVGT